MAEDIGLYTEPELIGSDPIAAAEISVLGGMLVFAGDERQVEAIKAATAIVDPTMFTNPQRRTLFRAMTRVLDSGSALDVVTLTEDLRGRDELEEAGGYEHVSDLLVAVPTAANIKYHAQIVRDKALRRRLEDTGRLITDAAGDGNQPVEDIYAEALEQLRGAQRDVAGSYQLLSDADIVAMKPANELIGGILAEGSLAALVGPPGSAKTFAVLDWALCVQYGMRWIGGHGARQGQVVYVIAEGSAGFGRRILAWCDYHGLDDLPGVRFVTQPVPLMDPTATTRFLADMDRQVDEPPALVIFDTLARCMVGGDENSVQDMGLFIHGADRIREETGAAVLLVHHMNASGERERGSTALRGAVDTMVKLAFEDRVLRLSCEKQKDSLPFNTIDLQLVPHAGSAILAPIRTVAPDGLELHPGEMETLRALQQSAPPEGLSATAWKEVAEGAPRTFYLHRKALLDKGMVDRDAERQGARYWVTQKGRDALTATGATEVQS